MHNDITRVALAATEPEMLQNSMFSSPQGKGFGGTAERLNYAYTSTSTYTYTYTYTSTSTFTYTSTSILHLHMHTHLHACTYIYINVFLRK